MRLAQWGNSLAVRIPQDVIATLALQAGDDIELYVHGEREFAVKKKPAPAELLHNVRALRGRLPADFKFDRLDANAR